MEERVEFDINKALTSYDVDPATLEDAVVPVREAPTELLDCEDDPESLTKDLLDRVLDPVVEAITESPDGITVSSVFDTLRFILRWTSKDPAKVPVKVPTATLSQILDLLTSAIDAEVDAANGPLEADNQEEDLPHHKQILEMYAFLMRWTLMAVEKRTGEQPTTTAAKGRGKGAKAKSSQKDDNWDPTRQLSKALATLYRVLGLRLSRMFSTTIERDTFVGLITKPVWRILDNETRMKSVDIKQHCFRILCKAIKAHGQASNAQGMITQKLLDQEHLSEPLAEFLNILHREYAHPQLAEDVLKELSNRDFDTIGQKGEKGPKCVSIFLTKLSELNPEVVFKQMAMLQNLFDAKPHQLRNALIDACGNIIIMFSQQPIEGDNKKEMGRYIDLLEERCRDTNPYCRAKALKNLARLCEIEIIFQKFTKKRLRVAQVANLCLTHDSSHVRRHAIALLRKIIETHPYRMVNDGLLSSKEWNEQLLEVEAKINALKPQEEPSDPNEPTVDPSLLQDATQVENPAGGSNSQHQESEEEMARKAALIAENEAKMAELLEHRKYFCRVLDFIGIINDSADIIIQYFASKTKTEVIEAMDFFTLIDAYKVDNARKGIRRMLRLIWSKGTNEEGKSIQAHLIECYKNLYFTPPPNFDENNAANYLARNMISLTYLDTPAELTSLEELIRIMKQQGAIKDLVIEKLWQVYGYQKKETSKSQRRGAIMVLGMLALADPNIIRERMGICLRIGLGKYGRQDLGLARYTCIALRRISPSPGKQSTRASPESAVKLQNNHEVLGKLVAITEMISDSNEWFGVAEQAISAIYVLAAQPDALCSEIIKRKAKYVFSLGQRPTSSGSNASLRSQSHVSQDTPMQDVHMEDVEMKDADMEDIKMEDVEMEDAPAELPRQPKRQNSALALSQLLFIVGHVAIKQIVHLELCEQAYKRQKAEQSKKAPRESVATEGDSTLRRGRKQSAKAPAPTAEEADELDRMAGDDEEHFTETIAYIRENELLYDFRSALLSNFGRLVSDICRNYTSYNHPTLQSQAALCLAKLMCVSERYCKENLQLLFDVLERSKDPVVRSNLVIAVGDMAIHFHHVIAEKSEFLFRRLNDRDASVKRTCLMTLTFLILSSHVKVIKGQLGEMAKCLEDDDKRILDMARMFFNEYANKDENNIYNQFMEMFSTLSADTELDEEAFQRIIKFIAKRVTKDKHQKQLAGKLASRLAKADTQRKWNDAAYTIGLLHPKDEEIRLQLEEGFKVVQTEA